MLNISPSIVQIEDSSTNAVYYPALAKTSTGTMVQAAISSSKLTFNPNTGEFNVLGPITGTTKSFLIHHPLKEGKMLCYGSLEGPEYGIYVRGRLTKDTVIELPDYWEKLADETSITVQLTPIGDYQELFVKEVSNKKIVVGIKKGFLKLGAHIDCFYTVYAERKDVPKLQVER